MYANCQCTVNCISSSEFFLYCRLSLHFAVLKLSIPHNPLWQLLERLSKFLESFSWTPCQWLQEFTVCSHPAVSEFLVLFYWQWSILNQLFVRVMRCMSLVSTFTRGCLCFQHIYWWGMVFWYLYQKWAAGGCVILFPTPPIHLFLLFNFNRVWCFFLSFFFYSANT